MNSENVGDLRNKVRMKSHLGKFAHSECEDTKSDDNEGRELAKVRLLKTVQSLKKELSKAEALLKIAEAAEPGSPLEEVLWEASFYLRR